MQTPNDFLGEPRLREVDHVDVGGSPRAAYDLVRHLDLGRSSLVRALFSVRTLVAPEGSASLRLDDLVRRADGAGGFQLLADTRGEGFVLGAIGRFWEPEVSYASVDGEAFADFEEAGWGKLVLGVHFEPRGEEATRVVLELLLTATDDDSWHQFRRYFRLIGPVSRFLRHHLLSLVHSDLGSPEALDNRRLLTGDELLPEAKAQTTYAMTIAASTAAIWPWLAQMGGQRAGWYSYDRLDHAGIPSARHVVPSLQALSVGDRLAASPEVDDGYDVAWVDPGRALVLHAVYDVQAAKQVPASEPRPEHYFEVSWAFVLEPLGHGETRLITRVRGDFTPDQRLRALSRIPIHSIMERQQLLNIKRRAEGRMPRNSARAEDILDGFVGALGMLLDFATPFLRGVRSHWGLSREEAHEERPGDDLVPEPRWSWTHGVRIGAAASRVWPWVAQLGQGKGGFYSYQFLENLAGCDIDNAEVVHPEWQDVRVGDPFRLHPAGEPMHVVRVERGRYLLVEGRMDPTTAGPIGRERPEEAVQVSWLFLLEELGPEESQVISRFRIRYGDGVRARLAYGPWLTESVGFVMDRRMLLGLKERAERP